MGGPGALRLFRVEQVALLQYITPLEAMQRLGANHGYGAIEVTLR